MRRSGFPLFGYPKGWFLLAYSQDLPTQAPLSLSCFGRDVVAYRGSDGKVRVVDAYCPHLGAHLGHGGAVEGKDLRCPFHHFRYDGDTGQCVEIPYLKGGKLPERARLTTWCVREICGTIVVWFDPQGGAPTFELDPLKLMPHWGQGDWTPWAVRSVRIQSHPAVILENLADIAHFEFIHTSVFEHYEIHYDTHTVRSYGEGYAHPMASGGVDRDHKLPLANELTYYGPGFAVQSFGPAARIPIYSLTTSTPIEELEAGLFELEVRFGVTCQIPDASEKTKKMLDRAVESMMFSFDQDVPIWAHQIYQDKPALCSADGPIAQLRAWNRQWYSGAVQSGRDL